MLRVSFYLDTCTIHHPDWIYTFQKSLLTPPLWKSMRSLLDSDYALSLQQSVDLDKIHLKIQQEKTTDYPFREALQSTYLIELIHFIIKLKPPQPNYPH